MSDWIKEGVAERSSARIAPVRHLLVDDGGNWSLWCSTGKGRPQTPVLGNKRFCRECLALAREAIEREALAPADVNGWPVEQAAAARARFYRSRSWNPGRSKNTEDADA